MAYDYQMGGYIEGETPEEYQRRQEEERKRQEALNTPVKQTIVTNPDGTQEVTVKGTPEALSSANPNTPTLVQPGQPVSPDESAAETARLQRQAQTATGVPQGNDLSALARNFIKPAQQQEAPPAPPAPPATPAVPANYNNYIAQNESGGNANIGYHNPQASTAYGPYGMTAGAYQDARKLNPALPQNITQATPEQQTAAQNAYTQQNAKYLQTYGVEPTPGNLAGAHFLGAKGLSDYLKTGYISPEAAAANGGEAKVKQIVDQRLAMGGAPASGAATNTAALTYQNPIETGRTTPVEQINPNSFDNRFTAAATDPRRLLDLHNDQNLTPEQRTLAGKQAQQLLNQQMGQVRGKEELASMSETDIARLLKNKSEEGSYAKMLLLGFISPALALKEANKLGLNDQWSTSLDADGKPVLMKTRDGVPIEGVSGETGKALSARELIAASAQAVSIKGANASSQIYRDPATGQTLTKVDTPQGPIYYDKARQRVVPKGEPIPLTAGSDITTQLQLSQMKRQQAFVGQTAAARIQSYKEVNNERALAGMAPLTPEQMGINANGELIGQAQPTVPGLAAPAPAGAAAAPAAGGAVAPTGAPAAVAPAVPGSVATGGAAVTTTPAANTAQTPGEMKAAREAAAAAAKTEATKTAENLVADREALPKIESSAENTLRTLNDVLYETDAKGNIKRDRSGRPKVNPGFETNVGVPGVTGILQLPGTAARDWQAKYKQLQGQQFLEAFNSLRGGGSITEVEGTKAEQAIAALRDPGISEVEFRRNATILEDTIKRGVDRARAKVGQKPKYNTETEATPAPAPTSAPVASGTTSSGNKFKKVE
jgi:hypothetical protein